MIDDRTPVIKRNKEWIKENALRITRSASVKDIDYKNEKTYWDYYNNTPDTKKHEFLRKVGENIELPVYYYHIPLQRTLVDSLLSQQVNRPFNFSVSMTDKDSLKDKYRNQLKEYLEFAMGNAEKKVTLLTDTAQQIQEQVQQLEQSVQEGQMQLQQQQEAGQQPDPKQIEQLQMMAQQLPLIKKQAEQQLKLIEKQNIITNEEIEHIKQNQILSWKDIKEIIAQKTLIKLRQELKIESKSTKNLLSKLVTGKERYFVYYDGKTDLPQYEVLNPINVIYPYIEGVDNISKGPWVKIRERMSYHQIISNWGEEIEEAYGSKAMNDLSAYAHFNINNGTFVSTPLNGAIFTSAMDSTFADNSGVTVDRIFFKANRKQMIKYSPNINSEGDLFRHFIEPTKELLKKEDYKYKTYPDENGVKKEYYINKKNEQIIYDAENVEFYSENKKETYKEKYTADRYEAIIINDQYVIGLKRSEYVIRNVDKYSDLNLPVFGKSFSSIMEQPYSIIGATIDLQDLYDVVHMQEQLMISLAGTKGNVIDRSQKPTSMSDETWEYNMKMGRMYIQTRGPNGENLGATYNQWSSYDNSLSPSIQFLGQIKDRLENTMGNIIGVGRQRKGQVVPSDQVATFEMAIQQNELITQILFYDHDEEEAEAMIEALHLALRYCYINNDIIDIQSKELGTELFVIPVNLCNKTQYKFHIANNTKEERTLKDIRSLLMNSWKQGSTPLANVVDAMIEDSLTELRGKIRYWDEKAQKLAEQSQNAKMEEIAQIEKMKAQYKVEFEKDWKDQELKLKEQMNVIEGKRLEIESGLKQRDQEIQLKFNEDTNKLALLKILNEDKSETGVLMENKEARINAQKLEALQIKLNAMMEGMNLNITKDANDKKHVHDMKKVEVDKANKIVKERVRD